jgi:hypothetical protein
VSSTEGDRLQSACPVRDGRAHLLTGEAIGDANGTAITVQRVARTPAAPRWDTDDIFAPQRETGSDHPAIVETGEPSEEQEEWYC